MLPGLAAGVTGAALGVASASLGSPLLAVGSAAGALGAAAWSLAMLHAAQSAERQVVGTNVELTALHELDAVTAPTLVDPDTGFPDGRFFELSLVSRISAARRHLWPVTVVMLDAALAPDVVSASATVAAFATLLRETLREADVICRLGANSYALLLEDTSEGGGVWAAERVQAGLAREALPFRRLSAGVASYPTHGLEPADVLLRARSALARACAAESGFGLGFVEVAHVEPA